MKLTKNVIQASVLGSLVILLLNVSIFGYARIGEYPPENVVYTAILLSLLPAAILILALYLSKGPQTGSSGSCSASCR